MSHFDSILFDMDGTLWDAVDSYCAVWNRTIADFGLSARPVERPQLAPLMGKPLMEIYDRLVGDKADPGRFIAALTANERDMMPALGGVLYPGVEATLAALSDGHRLFMVSNCGADGLPNFMRFTGLGHLFTDMRSFGQTGKEKDANIRDLVERYSLEQPLYVGDVASDCADAHRAGVPFAWARYGFGTDVPGADYTLGAVSDLLTICND